jgi:hypothetical protein
MHRNTAELETLLDQILAAPTGIGRLEMIVRRPADREREVVQSGQLDLDEGLVGDNWEARGNAHMENGAADPQAQVTPTGGSAQAASTNPAAITMSPRTRFN